MSKGRKTNNNSHRKLLNSSNGNANTNNSKANNANGNANNSNANNANANNANANNANANNINKGHISKRTKGNLNSRIFSLILTAGILLMIVLAGPANAFILSLDIDDNNVEKSELVKFTATISLQSSDNFIAINNITLNLNGPKNLSCIFDINGNPLSGCSGINITKLTGLNSSQGYGYGYGYFNNIGYNFGYGYGYGYGSGTGNLSFEIELNSSILDAGNYSSSLIININGNEFSQNGAILTVNPNTNNNANSNTINSQSSDSDKDKQSSDDEGGRFFGGRLILDKTDETSGNKANENINNHNDADINLELDRFTDQADALAGITGAFIGALKEPSRLIGILILFLVFLSSLLYFLRKQSRNFIRR